MGRERRQQSRHEVDTTATILLVNVGSTLRGRILDLSLTGCRIRTDEHFPVGIYTRVETEFRYQGLPFRLGGVIQAIHDRNTVGIRFLDLSQRKREQVLELIGEIDAMRAAAAGRSRRPRLTAKRRRNNLQIEASALGLCSASAGRNYLTGSISM